MDNTRVRRDEDKRSNISAIFCITFRFSAIDVDSGKQAKFLGSSLICKIFFILLTFFRLFSAALHKVIQVEPSGFQVHFLP